MPRVRVLAGLFGALLVATAAVAQSGPAASTDPAYTLSPPPRALKYRFVPEKSTIAFELPTTFKMVHGRVGAWSGEVEADPKSPGVLRSRLEFRADSLETGNARRDVVMRDKVLEASQFPDIVFEAKTYKGNLASFAPGGKIDAELTGEVTIHGVAKPLQASIQCAVLEDHVLIAGAVPIHWKQHGLHNPSTLFNRVQDPLTVIFHLWAVPEN
jgi:polyisoprenoid-binding protein YceI